MKVECPHCYGENLYPTDECANCGGIIDTDRDAQNETAIGTSTPVLIMTEMPSGEEIIITKSGIIGREGNIAVEYFSGCKCVSRRHCEISLESNEFLIEHLHTAMHATRIDNIPIGKGLKRTLKDKCIITIADKNFRVSIKKQNAEDASSQTLPHNAAMDDAPVPEPQFLIVCTECGTSYPVATEDDRIKECNVCDEFDRHKISRVKAIITYADR